jgi:hypothetical protein
VEAIRKEMELKGGKKKSTYCVSGTTLGPLHVFSCSPYNKQMKCLPFIFIFCEKTEVSESVNGLPDIQL